MTLVFMTKLLFALKESYVGLPAFSINAAKSGYA
jgi:hypothetical protein